jgi:surfeit locus 1 family protein
MSLGRFSPGRASTVTVILLFPLLLRLGFWQLDRAEQKKALFAAREAQWGAPPVNIDSLEVMRSPALKPGRAVLLQGRYRAPTILLDNRPRDGMTGYEVLSPFLLETGGSVLVARGWVPANPDRGVLPEVNNPDTTVSIRGRWGSPPSAGIRLAGEAGAPERVAAEMLRVARINNGELASTLGISLPPELVFLDPDQENGYDRRWPTPSADVAKHQAYATQWFAMAAVLLLLYFKINLRPRAQP